MCLLFVELSVAACPSLSPFGASVASAVSGSQYEAPGMDASFAEVLGAVFLLAAGLRGLLTALCCTLVTFGAVLCNGPLRDGKLPNRAERLSVMMEFS